MSLNFPDVCKTPAPPAPFIPVPYPDLGLNMQAAPFSPFVCVGFMPATNMGTLKVMTSGDEAGAMGGLITGMIKGPGKTTMGNPLVFVTGLPSETLLNPTSGNMMNAPVGAQIVPSVVNVFFTRRGGPDAHASAAPLEGAAPVMTEREIRALCDVARGEGAAADAARVHVTQRRDGVVVVRIACFDGSTDRRVFHALRDPALGEVRGVVFDLRGNPGGDAEAAIRLAGDCLCDGSPMLRVVDADGDDELLTARGAQTHHAPASVLVDATTASAAELFTAALQSAGRATVFGGRTYGKGTAQQAVLGGDGQLRYLTVQSYRRVDGEPLDGVGIRPDVELTAACSDADDTWVELAARHLVAR